MLIIATANILNINKDRIVKMILAGTDILRYNLAYCNHNEIEERVKTIQEAKETIQSNIKLLFDFPLNKARFGDFENKIFAVQENEEMVLQSAPYSPDCNSFIPINTKKIGERVVPNQTITLANGRVSLQVTQIINSESVKVRVLNNGLLKARQTVNANLCIDDSTMLETYKTLLEKIATIKPDYLSISYLNKEFFNLIKELEIIKQLSQNTKFVIKIESGNTADEIRGLCQDKFIHALLIDRGEIGVNTPFERLGLYQKEIISTAKSYSKPTWVSTQVLDSTIDNYIPTRSDILDLTNIILDGATGIMLSKETSASQRPAYAITVAKRIINEIKKYQPAPLI